MESKIRKTHQSNLGTDTCLECRESLLRFEKIEFELKKSHERLKKLKTHPHLKDILAAEEELQRQKEMCTKGQVDEVKTKESQQSTKKKSTAKTEVKGHHPHRMKTRQSTITKPICIDINIRNDLFVENPRVQCLNCSKTEEELLMLKTELEELNSKLKELENDELSETEDENNTGERNQGDEV